MSHGNGSCCLQALMNACGCGGIQARIMSCMNRCCCPCRCCCDPCRKDRDDKHDRAEWCDRDDRRDKDDRDDRDGCRRDCRCNPCCDC